MASYAGDFSTGITSILIGLLMVFTNRSVHCFNIDVEKRIQLIQRDARGSSDFGFSVEFLQSKNKVLALVGAPRAQTNQPGVHKGGAVYQCPTKTTTRSECSPFIFDDAGNSELLHGGHNIFIDEKSNQWFGATLVASAEKKSVVACAPRYTYFYSAVDKKEPVGSCWYASQDESGEITRPREFSPCRVETQSQFSSGHHRLGFCMAGFSAALGPEQYHTLFLGAPGAWYWQGAISSYDLTKEPTPDEEDRQPPPVTQGNVTAKELDDQYMGYAMTAGDFDGDGNSIEVAVGVPKGHYYFGEVRIFSSERVVLQKITGEQIGSYFGSTLAVADMDGDGLTDLIVGAPMFTPQLKSVESFDSTQSDSGTQTQGSTTSRGKQTGGYEAGKIYIFWQDADSPNSRFHNRAVSGIAGKNDWGRLGHAIAAVGDLNGDGLTDIVVGAPYDGENGQGAVYVFNGNRERRITEASQVIYGRNVQNNLKSFGFSVSGGLDVDNNTYPDIVVGAYLSGQAYVFRSRPVIAVNGSVRLSAQEIDLSEDDATVYVDYCMDYSSKRNYPGLNVKTTTVLDKRATFDLSKQQRKTEDVKVTHLTAAGQPVCIEPPLSFVVPTTIVDKLTPIVVNVTYSFDDPPQTAGDLKTIKSALVPPYWTTTLKIKNNCGEGQLCIPDLKVTATSSKSIIAYGANDLFNLSIKVDNSANAKDAHQAKVYVLVPAHVTPIRHPCNATNEQNDLRHAPSLPRGVQGSSVLKCDVGNPLPSGFEKMLNIEFQVARTPVDLSALIFHMEVNSSLPDDVPTRKDNVFVIKVPLELDLNLALHQYAPPEIEYSEQDDKIKDIPERISDPSLVGPYVTHKFSIKNNASKTFVRKGQFRIFFPHRTQENQFLLYILRTADTESTSAPIVCAVKDGQGVNINPMRWNVPTVIPDTPSQRSKRQTRTNLARAEAIQGNDKWLMSQAFIDFVNEVKETKESKQTIARHWRSLVRRQKLDCLHMKCTEFICNVSDLAPGQSATVKIHSTLYVRTLLKEPAARAVISSLGVFEVIQVGTGAQGNIQNLPLPTNITLPVVAVIASTTVIRKAGVTVARGIPSWIIIVAILIGITLLALLILLLWRLGFFKRQRPPRGQALLKEAEGPEARGQYSTYSPATREYGSAYRPPPYGEHL